MDTLKKKPSLQRQVAVLLLVAVTLASTFTALSLGWLAARDLSAYAEQAIDLFHSQLKAGFYAFDVLLAEEELALDKRLQEHLPRLTNELIAQGPPAEASVERLNALCQRYGLDHLYVINADGVVINTNFPPDLGLDLKRIGPAMEAMLERLYGRGEVLSDRFNISVKTGIIRKYAYYSPPGADYIIDASLDLRAFIERTVSPALQRLIFDELLQVPAELNSSLLELDIYLANGFGAWSLVDSGEAPPEAVMAAFQDKDRQEMRLEEGNTLTIYQRVYRLRGETGQADSLITKVAYDISDHKRLQRRTLMVAALSALLVTLLAFVLIRPLFSHRLIQPVSRIAAGLEALGEGRYEPLPSSGVSELDLMTSSINRIEAQIQARETALVQANERLEARVRERTEELEQLLAQESRRRRTLAFNHGKAQELNALLTDLQQLNDIDSALALLGERLPALWHDLPGAFYLVTRTQELILQRHWGTTLPPARVQTDPGWHCLSIAYTHPHQGVQRAALLCLDISSPVASSIELDRTQWVSLLEQASERISLALSRLSLQQVLSQISYEDGLTAVNNRRFLDEVLPREILLARRNQTPLSVLICDIDFFKQFNDNHGHAAGDEALKIVASRLQENIRQSDILCRYGGEEFVVILPTAGADQARERAEQVRQAVAATQVSFQGQELGRISLSIGLCSWPEQCDDPEQLLQRADAALYGAKQAGRNRVRSCAESAG